jgi:hypothetical protein
VHPVGHAAQHYLNVFQEKGQSLFVEGIDRERLADGGAHKLVHALAIFLGVGEVAIAHFDAFGGSKFGEIVGCGSALHACAKYSEGFIHRWKISGTPLSRAGPLGPFYLCGRAHFLTAWALNCSW